MTVKSLNTHNRKRRFCTFNIADHLFGVDILDVKEIKDEFIFTRIYHAPDEVKGFVNIRGHVYLVLDLRYILGFSKKDLNELSRVLLFKESVGVSFGILVDQIRDMVTVDHVKIESYSKDQQSKIKTDHNQSELIQGICKLDQNLLLILNSRKLLDSIKQPERLQII